jgi:single-stranded DNA-binding protein
MNIFTCTAKLLRDPETKPAGNHTKTTFPFGIFGRKPKNAAPDAKCPVQWLRAMAWNEAGDKIAANFKKGDTVLLVGTLEPTEWTNKEGETKSELVLNINQWEFVSDRSDRAAADKPKTEACKPEPKAEAGETDDDLPF